MDKDRVAPALGQITSGLFIATATVDEDENGDNAEEGNDPEGGETEDADAAATAAAPTVLVERPAKRSRTAYFIFADVMRPSLRQEVREDGNNCGTEKQHNYIKSSVGAIFVVPRCC